MTESLINTDIKPRRHLGLLSVNKNTARRPPQFRTIQSLQAKDGCKLLYGTKFTFGDAAERDQMNAKLHIISDSFYALGALVGNMKARRV